MRSAIATTILLAALALPATALAAASGCPKTTLGDIEDEVMCSIC